MQITALLTLATALSGVIAAPSPIKRAREDDPEWLPSKKAQAAADITAADLGLNASEWFTKYGFPGPVAQSKVLTRDPYVTVPNAETKNPYWVIEHISKESIAVHDGVSRDKSKFKVDTDIPEGSRSALTDYYKSGYDRGHQAPAGNVQYSQSALDQTFLLSNMCPQVGKGFNRNYWAWTEEFPRNMTGTYDTVRIMTGPLYLKDESTPDTTYSTMKTIGDDKVVVPSHFFKAIIGENKDATTVDAAAFVLPNQAIDDSVSLTSFQVGFDKLSTLADFKVMQDVDTSVKVNDLCKKIECKIHVYSHDRYNGGSGSS